MRNILIVKTSSLGDILHTFPVLDFFSRYYPEIRIDWVVEKPFASLVSSHPGIHRTLMIDTKQWRSRWARFSTWKEIRNSMRRLRESAYEVVFDLQGNTKSALVTLAARSRKKVGFAQGALAEWPNLFVTNQRHLPPPGRNIRQDYLHLVQTYFRDFRSPVPQPLRLRLTGEERKIFEERRSLLSKEAILVCPGAHWKNKRMTTKTWSAFLQLLHEKYGFHFGILWGNEEERFVAQEIVAANLFMQRIERMPLPVLQNLMGTVPAVLAMDSLPLHLAETAGAKTWSAFGPSLATKYSPIGEGHAAFQGLCPYQIAFTKRCPRLRSCPTGSCLHDISPDDLLAHFSKWWDH